MLHSATHLPGSAMSKTLCGCSRHCGVVLYNIKRQLLLATCFTRWFLSHLVDMGRWGLCKIGGLHCASVSDFLCAAAHSVEISAPLSVNQTIQNAVYKRCLCMDQDLDQWLHLQFSCGTAMTAGRWHFETSVVTVYINLRKKYINHLPFRVEQTSHMLKHSSVCV